RRRRAAAQRGRARERRHALDSPRHRGRPRPRLRLPDAEARGGSVRLEGQRAIVFGGGSGVGLATAKLLAEEGAEVVITGRGAEKLEAAAKGIEGRVTARAVDGRSVDAVKAFFAEAGAFDHLVIPAGQTNRGGSFLDDITDAKFR